MINDKIEATLVNLDESEKRYLLQRLVEELDAGQDPDSEGAWLAEAQRRHRELKEGAATGVPAAESLSKARARLRHAH